MFFFPSFPKQEVSILASKFVFERLFHVVVVGIRDEHATRGELLPSGYVAPVDFDLGLIEIFDRVEAIVEPDARHNHFVLRERARLVRANHRGRAERLHRFQIFDQTVFLEHTFGNERQRHRDRGQQAFGHFGHQNADQEDDCVEPVIAVEDRDGEEGCSYDESDY